MTDDPNERERADGKPAEPKEDETRPVAETETAVGDTVSPSPAAPIEGAGAPPLPASDEPPPTPESQAALTGKAPSGHSSSGTTMPASSGEAEDAQPAKPSSTGATTKPAIPADETPEEKKARLARVIAEARAKKEAAARADEAEGASPAPPGGESPAVGHPLQNPSQAELERAAKIAAAKARAAALKDAAASKPAAASDSTSAPASPAGAPKPPVKKKDEGPKPVDASDHPLARRLRERFAGAVQEATAFINQLSIRVAPESIVEVCRALRDDEETRFDFLSDLTCVHWPEHEGAQFEVVYHLYSIPRNERVRLKVWADAASGVESVTTVWPTANWMEREVFDLFGVVFRNHPDMRRLLLPEDWQGHPLRKEYPLEAMENEWTAKHLPEFTEVQREQLEQRRAYGLELLSTPDERRLREIFLAGRQPMPLDRK